MIETGRAYEFTTNKENNLYLSLVEPAWRSALINKALGRYLSEQAMIDIADGNGVVSFWRKLDSHKKNEVLRRLVSKDQPGSEGLDEEKADPELWDIVTKSEPWDMYHFAAKYLTLHQLKYGKPWAAATKITGEYTREIQKQRRRKVRRK